MFDSEAVRTAAASYVRVLIRVPEAYLLLRRFDTTRPGLLVLDADGRRVGSLDLSPVLRGELSAKDVAAWLDTASEKAPRERFVIEGGGAEFRKTVALVEGVEIGANTIDAPVGALPPSRLLAMAKAAGGAFRIRDPVAVPLTGEPTRKFGIWYSEEKPRRVWIPRLLAHPDGLPGDLVRKPFDFETISTSASGYRALAAPLSVDGVVTVFPDLDEKKVTVVARRGKVDWEQVAATFGKAGAVLLKADRSGD